TDPNEIYANATAEGLGHKQAFDKAMLTGNYQYRIANNDFTYGVITREIYDSLPKSVRKKKGVSFEKLKGRPYVTLKQFALEFKPELGVQIGSGTARSSTLAQQDTASRRVSLRNILFGNRDDKDDNSRSVVLEFEKGDHNELPRVRVIRRGNGKGSVYVEF